MIRRIRYSTYRTSVPGVSIALWQTQEIEFDASGLLTRMSR